jgi:hypothetical protein
VAQRRDEGRGLPTPEWRLANHAAAARPPAPKRSHIGLGPGLIDEDEALRIDAALIFAPLLAPALNVIAILFLGRLLFFYGFSPSACRNSQTERWSTFSPRTLFEICLPFYFLSEGCRIVAG